MPTGIYVRKPFTKEHKINMSENNWMKGKTGEQCPGYGYRHSKKAKEKISEALRNQWKNGERVSGMKGKKTTEEHRRRLSDAHRGEKNYNWKGGITLKNKAIKDTIEYRLWREAVFARDNWTCQKYGIRGGRLRPHHIQNFAQYPELRFAIDNGITLSEKAHKEFHKIYGKKNNTREQLIKFQNNQVA